MDKRLAKIKNKNYFTHDNKMKKDEFLNDWNYIIQLAIEGDEIKQGKDEFISNG